MMIEDDEEELRRQADRARPEFQVMIREDLADPEFMAIFEAKKPAAVPAPPKDAPAADPGDEPISPPPEDTHDEEIIDPPGTDDPAAGLDDEDDPSLDPENLGDVPDGEPDAIDPLPGSEEDVAEELLEPQEDLDKQLRARFYDACEEASKQAEALGLAAEKAGEGLTGEARRACNMVATSMKSLGGQIKTAQETWGELSTVRCAEFTGTVEERVTMAAGLLNELIDDGTKRE